jgi:hemerythrin superfamily protein
MGRGVFVCERSTGAAPTMELVGAHAVHRSTGVRTAMAVTQAETKRRTASRKAAPDAIKLLKDDHRQVEDWFEQFEKTNSGSKKQKLADQICLALRVHTQIEEEIFYPACREAGIEEDMMDEADVEHESAKKLIEEIESGKPGDDHWDAKVKVLSEMIKHHVKEEEQRDGMFAKAKKADLDLGALGEELKARKGELMKQKKNGRN